MAKIPQTAHIDWKPSPEDVQGLSRLRIPEHHEIQEDSFLLDHQETEEWISSLPMANIRETARLIFETLVDFNRQAIPDQTRIKTAELFRQPTHYISSNFEKYYIEAAFPLSIKNRKIVLLNRELYSELAISYKIFIQSALSSNKRISKRLLAIAIHRAVCHLSDILLISSLVYEPPPQNTWLEIHYLYALAVKNEVHKLPIEDSLEKGADSSCISSLYKRILLYTLASPCYLRQRENQFLYKKLIEWADYVELSTPDTLSNFSEQFITHLLSDDPPHHISLEKRGLSKRCCLLDTRGLVRHMQKMLATETAPQPEGKNLPAASIPKPLLEHLIKNLSTRPRRKYARTKLHFGLKLAIGIPTVHTMIKARAQKNAAIPEYHPADSERLDQHIPHNYPYHLDPHSEWDDSSSTMVFDPLSEDTSSKRHFPSYDAETTLKDNVHAPWAGAIPQNGARIFECKTSNASAGGYCIDWEGTNAPKIKPGELIGIQSTINDGQFGIGATRWIKTTQGQKLQLGMQLIAPNSFAVQTRLDVDGCDNAPCIFECLLVPEAKTMATPLSLITPAHSYREGDIIWINSGNSERRIRLAHKLETTAAFTQYQIAYYS